MKTYVIGDIHGACRALRQCIERSGFDAQRDRLICLGDVCDGWPEVKASFAVLLELKNLVYILGNHDAWALEWARWGHKPDIWTSQGGLNTLRSYGKEGMPKSHVDLLSTAPLYFREEGRLFVHGGFNPTVPIEQQSPDALLWDRNLLMLAQRFSLTDPDYQFGFVQEIYVGHTTTQAFHIHEPVRFCNVWALDTGAGWSGKLSIMNVATKEFWQSDTVRDLYPDETGRGR